MQFIDLAKKRYSSRKYKKQQVEHEKILKILEAARVAPSASNKQPWKFVVFTKPESLEIAHQLYHRDWFKNAPVVIVALAEYDKAWERAQDNKNHAEIDVTIALDHITLQATELGLATCWICNFYVDKTREKLRLPPNIEPVAILSLAYPDDEVDPNRHDTKRKSLDEIVSWEISPYENMV